MTVLGILNVSWCEVDPLPRAFLQPNLMLKHVLLLGEMDAVGVLELGHVGEDDAVALF